MGHVRLGEFSVRRRHGHRHLARLLPGIGAEFRRRACRRHRILGLYQFDVITAGRSGWAVSRRDGRCHRRQEAIPFHRALSWRLGFSGACMGFKPIKKNLNALKVTPNLDDYARTCAEFAWEKAEQAITRLPGNGGLNIAYECVDRHGR